MSDNLLQIIKNLIFLKAHAQSITRASQETAQNTVGFFDKAGELITNFLLSIPLWFMAAFVFWIFYLLAKYSRTIVEKRFENNANIASHNELKAAFSRIAFLSVIILGVTVSLSVVGINLSAIAAAASFGVGFALKDILMNTVAGLVILTSRHFTIGDIINVKGIAGKIEEIQSRATLIRAFDGTRIVVPNADLFNNVVISKTSNPVRRLAFKVGVDYNSDLRKVVELSRAVLKQIPGVVSTPSPRVFISSWADSAVIVILHVWIESKGGKYFKVKNQVVIDIHEAFAFAGINIPFPITTLNTDMKEAPEELIDQTKTQRLQSILADVNKKVTEHKYNEKNSSANAQPAIQSVVQPPVSQTNQTLTEEIGGANWIKEAVQTAQNPQQQTVSPAVDTTPLQSVTPQPAQPIVQTQNNSPEVVLITPPPAQA